MRWIASISLLLLLSGLPAPSTGVASAAPVPTVKAIDWKPCPDEETNECGTVPVPVDWARPTGPGIDLTVARRKADDQKHKIGSLFLLTSGLGGSGVEEVSIASYLLRPELLKRFDIVGFDARGIGRSHPLRCPATPKPPARFPRDAASYQRAVQFNHQYAEECRRLTGPLFDHVDTLSTVRDTDAVRAALGERQISLYGEVYGTLIGQQYAEEYPGHVRALALDGSVDHSLTSTRQFLLDQSAAVEGGYREFAAWCATSTRCALHGQDPLKVLDTLMAKADRGELKNPDKPDSRIEPEDLSATIRRAMFGTRDWAGLSKALATLRGVEPEGWRDAYHSVFCSDFTFPVRDFEEARSLMNASRQVAPHTRVHTLGWTDLITCQGFVPKPPNPQRPYHVKGTPPSLVANARYDVLTPYPWAENVTRQIPGAVLLTYDGVSGTTFMDRDRPCMSALIDRYLLTLETPPPGTHCPAVPEPAEREPATGSPSKPTNRPPASPR